MSKGNECIQLIEILLREADRHGRIPLKPEEQPTWELLKIIRRFFGSRVRVS